MAPPTPSRVVRLPEEKNLDRQITICRFGAQTDNVTIHIMRERGSRRYPLIEITPDGVVHNIEAPAIRATLADRFPGLASVARQQLPEGYRPLPPAPRKTAA